MKLKDRIKNKLASINLISVAFFGLSIFSIAFAWFAYTNVVKTNFEVNVKSWKIRITKNNTEISNNYTFNVSDFYPGMSDFTDSFTIENQGELDAKLDYKIKKLRVFGISIDTENMTFYELQRDYPFKINFSYNKRYLAPNQTATFNVSCTWALDSGNDDLDTEYGNMAYDFYQSENALHQYDPSYQIRSGLELEVEIMAVQYLDETDSFANDSWDTIQINAERGLANSVYQVGETKEVTLYIGNTPANYTLRIVNTSNDDSICSNSTNSKTACGLVIEFERVIQRKRMHLTLDDITWPQTDTYKYINGEYFSYLPYELKKVIATTKVLSAGDSQSIPITSSNDKMYLLSINEISDGFPGSQTASKTRIIDYYHSHSLVKKRLQRDTNMGWWTRTKGSDIDKFKYVNSSGVIAEAYSTEPDGIGISPAFRIE